MNEYELERMESQWKGLATPDQAGREFALNCGADNPERAWILSDFDVWYPNPFYRGPKVPHPEDYSDYE